MRKRKKAPHTLFIFGFGFVLLAVGAALYLHFHAKSAPVYAPTSLYYPTVYSDSHITKTAIETDARFSNIAPKSSPDLLAAVLGAPPSKSLAPAQTEPERGSWVWQGPLEISSSERNSIIAEAKANDIHTIYLSLDSYLDMYVLPDGPQKQEKLHAFTSALEDFVTLAHENGIAVDAEGGWRNWAQPGNTYKALALLQFAKEYNATHHEKLRGFQYDIEPYLLSEYQGAGRVSVMKNYLDLMDATVTELDGSDLAFSVCIPDFYDGSGGSSPEFFYGVSYGFTFDHLLAILERRPGSTLIIMAYRNYSGGDDGSIQMAVNEIKAADHSHTKVIVAQETGKVSPSTVTFYRTSRSYFDTQVEAIQSAFAQDPSFGGFAFHYLNAFVALE